MVTKYYSNWEYKILTFTHAETEADLNALGMEGWELIGCHIHSASNMEGGSFIGNPYMMCVFKRRL